MSVVRRSVLTLVGVLVTLVMVLGMGVGLSPAHSGNVAAAATVADVPPVPHEDERGWNSCRYGDLGPCDMWATLPDGGFFRVEVSPVTVPGVACAAGTRVAVVSVLAVAVDGVRVNARESVTACVNASDDPLDNARAESLLPGLFAVVGARV